MEKPLGVDTGMPHLSWQLESGKRNVRQTAYRIIVSDDAALLQRNIGNVWDSRKVSSDASIQVAYGGRPLEPARTYYWKVEVWDNQSDAAWSPPASWQMGLLSPADWKGARWIAYEKLPDSERILPGSPFDKKEQRNDILPLLRKEFAISKPLKKAAVFISGLGQFEMYLNGKKVGDHVLDPGWTQYSREALYVSFDVTRQLRRGENALGVMLGNGFYYIPVWENRYRKLTVAYGYPKMICLLKLEYADGSSESIVSDDSWKAAPGPVVFSSEYGGEDYNAGLEKPGWDAPGFNDKGWRDAVAVDGPPVLRSQTEYPVKIFEHFSPQKIYRLKSGAWIYDLRQNASGIPLITVKGRKGDTVRMIPAEVLDASGAASQRGSGGPCYFDYILSGKGEETWHPRFSYYGFRYLEVEGAVPEGKPDPQGLPVVRMLQGLHIRNAASRVGSFSCSNGLFNRIYKLIDWAIQSNMMSLFTDCPHREKLGWLEEAHLMGNSIHYNYDIAGLCSRTILNMEAAQTPEGLVPDIAPEYVQFAGGFRDSPEWGSSSVLLPWYAYQWYGDVRVLEQSYDMMKRYVDYLGTKADHHIISYGLGDWFDLGPKRPGVAQLTPLGVTATAIYYYDLNILCRTAAVLHQQQDMQHYGEIAAEVKAAFNNSFFNRQTQEYATGSQASNAMAVYMQLVEPQDKAAVIGNIVKDIRSRGNSLTAGDVGYRYLLKALDDAGRGDVIFDMNNRTDVPGYGYQLAHGATALTESWQAYPSVSNDHLMLGHLMEWLYDGLGGIRAVDSSVAFHRIKIAPEPVDDITSADVSFVSPYGLIRSSWEKGKDIFSLTVTIPANTTAVIYLPADAKQTVTEGDKPLTGHGGVELQGYEDGKAIIRAGSGTYHFKVRE